MSRAMTTMASTKTRPIEIDTGDAIAKKHTETVRFYARHKILAFVNGKDEQVFVTLYKSRRKGPTNPPNFYKITTEFKNICSEMLAHKIGDVGVIEDFVITSDPVHGVHVVEKYRDPKQGVNIRVRDSDTFRIIEGTGFVIDNNYEGFDLSEDGMHASYIDTDDKRVPIVFSFEKESSPKPEWIKVG